MKSQFEESLIKETMKSRGITRKSAVRFLNRQMTVTSNLAVAAVAPAKDVKMAQTNDKQANGNKFIAHPPNQHRRSSRRNSAARRGRKVFACSFLLASRRSKTSSVYSERRVRP